ncbi:RNA polymerase sigma factor, sigma-70 family [Chryseobacterium oleae]|uniref:RNA polymerase sigma factor, sigma-70 family n=7 Tax=Chryseobacterium TaxID=59732 RepID=A0A1I4WHY8_CHROL|nr:RNA polymerase sigma factor, sigma-70 family [Chryseobacterium oleae]
MGFSPLKKESKQFGFSQNLKKQYHFNNSQNLLNPILTLPHHQQIIKSPYQQINASSYQQITALLLSSCHYISMTSREKEFAQLIKDNQGLIIKVSRLYTNSLEDEEDLFQEIVLQLWRSYDSFKGNSKISTWMYRVALNTAITLFRKKSKSLPTNELDINHRDFVEDDDDKQQQISLLYTVIKTLPNVERAIVMMYLDDLPYKDIAENLGITEVNARVKMNRLKKTLKEQMEKYA